MIGNTVGSIRRTVYCVPVGSDGIVRAIAESTSSVLATMSRPQPKSIEICADPRLVAERTSCTPGIARSASSIGRVTVSAVWSAGRLPASRSTTTRGKDTCGNSPIGSDSAATIPASASAMAITTKARDCSRSNRSSISASTARRHRR